VSRILLWVCLGVLPLLAADANLDRVLKGVEQRYNRAKTLKVLFNETYSVQGHPRKSESGDLTLRKPGRMRWQYDSPPGKLFVSDGKDVYLYSPDANRVERMRLKESEDMRAPLAFLLGKLDFAKEFRDFALKPIGENMQITAHAKTDKLPYEYILMLVSPDFSIHKLVVTGQDKAILIFNFDQERLNPVVDDAQFRFKMPPGATLVNPESGQ